MVEKVRKTDIVYELDKKIGAGVKILLFDYDEKKFLENLCNEILTKDIQDIEVWHCYEKYIGIPAANYISREEMNDLISLYMLYDFSDKVLLVSKDVKFPSLFNYLEQNIITKEELINALLK